MKLHANSNRVSQFRKLSQLLVKTNHLRVDLLGTYKSETPSGGARRRENVRNYSPGAVDSVPLEGAPIDRI